MTPRGPSQPSVPERDRSRVSPSAAADVYAGSTKRVAGAVGEGAMAVALAHQRLDEIDRGH